MMKKSVVAFSLLLLVSFVFSFLVFSFNLQAVPDCGAISSGSSCSIGSCAIEGGQGTIRFVSGSQANSYLFYCPGGYPSPNGGCNGIGSPSCTTDYIQFDSDDTVGICESTYYEGGNSYEQRSAVCLISGSGGSGGGTGGETSCLDPDGYDRYTKSTVTVTSYSGAQTYYTDSCAEEVSGPTSVYEAICGAYGSFAFAVLDCQYGCFDGKCNQAPPAAPTCSDSDGGVVMPVRGTVSTTMGPEGTDYCVSQHIAGLGSYFWSNPFFGSDEGSHLVEYYCTPFSGGDVGKQILIPCTYGCTLGECNSAPLDCSDSDGGKFPLIPGTTTQGSAIYKDRCIGGQVQEWFCSNGAANPEQLNCPVGRYCSYDSLGQAYCKIAPFCSDSDNGVNYNTQGTVSSHLGNFTDYCEEAIVIGGTGTDDPGSVVREFYCSGNSPLSSTYSCPFGCSNGRCSNEPAFCSDTDGGNKPYTGGTVTTNGNGVFTDACYSGTPIGTGQSITGFAVIDSSLSENFCSGTSRVTQNYDCPNGCFGGACVASYFGDTNGNNYTFSGYNNKNIGSTVYLWTAGIPEISPGGFVDGIFVGNYSLTIKEKDIVGDDTIRTNVRLNKFIPGFPGATKYGATWVITEEDIDACSDLSEGSECEFYFELVANEVLYRSPLTAPNLIVPTVAPLPSRYWADPFEPSVQWTNRQYDGPFSIGLIMTNYDDSAAQGEIGSEIDAIGNPVFGISGVETVPPYASHDYGTFTGSLYDIDDDGAKDDAYYIWAVNDNVLSQFSSNGPYEFTFSIDGGESPVFTLTKELGTCGNGVCEPPGENETTCPDDCLGQCAGINLCGDYITESMCNLDSCDVAGVTPPPAGPGQVNACGWNSASDPSCRKVLYSSTPSGASIGSCISEQSSNSEECSGGFLSYSWISTWNWYPDNNFDSLLECESYSSECIGNCFSGTDGTYHCDPNGAFALCQSGSAQIPCPAQIQLSFFDWKNVVVALLLIFILYVIFYKRKKKVSKEEPVTKVKKAKKKVKRK